MQVMAPALSSVILTFGGLDLVMKIDLLTLLPGLLAVLLIDLPMPERSADGQKAKGDFWHEFRFGFGYIFSRPGLRIITIVFMGVNLFAGLTYMSIISPMILTHTGGDKIALGTVQTVMGVGGILGGLILTFWHSPKKKVALFAWTTALSFLVCDTLMALSRSVWSWSLSGFLAEVTIPFMVSPFYSIWQERVPTDVQGRVFSVREMLLSLPSPIGFLVGGLLADHVFEPFFAHPNGLSPLLGWGPGVGMSAMFLASAVLGSLIGWLGVFHPEARKLDLS
jgi:predicted MFS family arabinose efflux permease